MPKQQSDILNALSKISQAITSESYLDDILKLIVTVTAQALNSKICSLMLLNDKGELEIKASQSISETYLKKPPLKVGEGVAGTVVKTQKPVVVDDIADSKLYKYKDIAEKEGLTSVLCVPLTVKGKSIGALDIYTTTSHAFSDNEIAVLSTVANQAAIVIENTELIVKTKIIQEELESRKLMERAKSILMKQNNMTEDVAFRSIQKQAMDKRKSIKEISEAIILVEELKRCS
ncbi:MAG TPA: GAF domain-containing protein [Elusimicrobiota bacterium]|nr:GAF domain-containing protein [Elusimicrobiota bacterium]